MRYVFVSRLITLSQIMRLLPKTSLTSVSICPYVLWLNANVFVKHAYLALVMRCCWEESPVNISRRFNRLGNGWHLDLVWMTWHHQYGWCYFKHRTPCAALFRCKAKSLWCQTWIKFLSGKWTFKMYTWQMSSIQRPWATTTKKSSYWASTHLLPHLAFLTALWSN